MPRGEVNQLLNYDFYCPAYEEQLRITNILGSIDKKIEINKKKIARLEAIAQDIYNYWFVQYEFPDETGKPYKSNGGKFVWNEELKRNIPIGWSTEKLSKMLYITSNSVNPQTLQEQYVEYYSIPAYDENRYPDFVTPKSIESDKYKVPTDAILISKLNPQFKRIWDPLCLNVNPICSTEFVVLRPYKIEQRSFCYALLDSENYHCYLKTRATSSTGSRKRIAPEICLQYSFAMPPMSIIKSFAKIYQPQLFDLKILMQANKKLTVHKNLLIPLLMNGQAIAR